MHGSKMGSVRDDHAGEFYPMKKDSTVANSGEEIQAFGNRFSLSPFSGDRSKGEDADQLQFLHTEPFDDTIPADSAFETQVVDLEGETQVLGDIDCISFSTQLWDDHDTEVVVDTDDEGTDRIVNLGDADDLFDKESCKSIGGHPVDEENTPHNIVSEQNDGKYDLLSKGVHSSGYTPKGYPSVHAASIRSSGLVANSKAFNETNNGSCSITSATLSPNQLTAYNKDAPSIEYSSQFRDDVNIEHAAENNDEQMKNRVGCSAVRKLFSDDAFAGNMNNADKNKLVGLSYVDSQEPGESAQADALDFVDQFVKSNVVEFDNEVNFCNSTGGKSKPVSSARGIQRLAKRTSFRSPLGECKTFDWDDNREDDGGGEIFIKKREAFFDCGGRRSRSFTKSRKPKIDSRMLLHNSKQNVESAEVKESDFKKNLSNELNEELNLGCEREIMDNGGHEDGDGMLGIGLDTQMAAEAMEALCVPVNVTEHDANKGAKNTVKGLKKRKINNKTHAMENHLQEETFSKSSSMTRKSKQRTTTTKLSRESSTSSLKQSKSVRKQCDQEPLHPKKFKRAKSGAKDLGSKANAMLEVFPTEINKPSGSACVTPINCRPSINEVSPLYKNLTRSSRMKELYGLIANAPELSCPIKDSRRRRDMAKVRVLFSQHLDDDVIKQQKKIVARLGASLASSISDATHFIADKFARTSNMLEAIALGKPIVTQLWIESCGLANCFIDERNYIMRDAKKEKELGFSMPVSLARAIQHPLLQGQRVVITPNTKPGKQILASLIKTVHGLVVERIGRIANEAKFPDDMLVLSCEEDYAVCVPFIDKGAAVYSSELLLNGIVTQKLDHERHRLFTNHVKKTDFFTDHVKKTRSRIWIKKREKYHSLHLTKFK